MYQSAFRPFKRELLFGRFLKNFLWSPLCTFLENAGFGWRCLNCHNLAIWALLEPLFTQSLFQSLHYKCILIRGYCHLRQSACRPFQRGHLLRRFLKSFPWFPLCTFPENAGFGWPCQNCHNLVIRELLEPLFCFKIFSSACTLNAYYLEDNAVCASLLLGISNEAYSLGYFWKIFLGPPFALFKKMRI